MVTNEGKFVCVGDFEQQGSSECFLLYRHAFIYLVKRTINSVSYYCVLTAANMQ